VGGGGCSLITWRQQGCSAFANVRLGGRFWAKNLKPSVCGSVSGVPRKMAAWGDGWMWWVRVGDMKAAWVLRIHQREAGGGRVWTKNLKPNVCAWFRGCRVERRHRVMVRGGGRGLVTWRGRDGVG
jgi:hypothetical protein